MDLSLRTIPLSQSDAFHLLRRCTYHPTWAQMSSLAGKTPAEAIDLLMSLNPAIPPPEWADDPPSGNFQDAQRLWPELQSWWISHCLQHTSFRERLVAMWHNHFTSDYITVYWAQWMVAQSNFLRQNCYNFKALGEGIVGDPAMLIYLNGNQSVKGNPNENFGREWFELFSLGIGNYTEFDIVEASRAFTGWRVSGLNATYTRQLADLGQKTILGQTGNWEYKDVIRITLEQPACARFIAAKLLRTFVEYYPSEESVNSVADLIVANQYNLKPVLRTILCSEGFYNEAIRGALIKDPMSVTIGLASTVGLPTVAASIIIAAMTGLTMIPFYPPTVQGWVGHHNWITSSTFPLRQRFAEAFLEGRQTASSNPLVDSAGNVIKPDLVALVRQFPDHDKAEEVVANMTKLLLPVATNKEQKAILLEIMMAGAPSYEWNIESPTAASRIKLLMQAIVRMPEFQLT